MTPSHIAQAQEIESRVGAWHATYARLLRDMNMRKGAMLANGIKQTPSDFWTPEALQELRA